MWGIFGDHALIFWYRIRRTGATSALPRCLVRLWAHVEGPGAVRRQGPKELLHHLPAFVLRRPSVSAHPTEKPSGIPGSRLLDRRPPHYRCPAVPGFNTSARAILMALGPSVHPSVINCLSGTDGRTFLAKQGTAFCWYRVLLKRPVSAPLSLSDSQPRRPSCFCSGLEPHCRTSRCARPQPTPSPRYRSLTSLLVGPAHGSPSSLRATRSGRQPRRRPATALASRLHHRTALRTATTYCNCVLRPTTATTYFCLAVRVCRALRSFWLREKP